MNQDNLINMNANNLFNVLKIKLILGKICPHLTLKKRSEVQSNMIYMESQILFPTSWYTSIQTNVYVLLNFDRHASATKHITSLANVTTAIDEIFFFTNVRKQTKTLSVNILNTLTVIKATYFILFLSPSGSFSQHNVIGS